MCARWQADREWAWQDDAEVALKREAAGLASWPPAQPLWPEFVPGQQGDSALKVLGTE